jgi:transcriptional regulator GlxA family with amidase domain
MTNSGPQPTNRTPLDIAIVNYPGAQLTCVHGLTDLFTYADYFARELAGTAEPFVRVAHWREKPAAAELECTFETHPGASATPTLVIVPACQVAPPARALAPHSAAWFRRQHDEHGAIVAAVCGGVFLVADSGLLAGRRVTTHWMFAEELGRRFPDLTINADRIVIDDGDVVTAAGVFAWADLGLTLVERVLGPAVMRATARFMLIEPPGREQSFYGDFGPRLRHGDQAILAIQHWLQTNSTEACSVRALAERAHLGERTFVRRFVKATGVTPSEYQQRLRIARSRELLELTRDTVDQIAVKLGYEDAGGFRRIFKRVVGLSPAEYRRRFQRERLVSTAVTNAPVAARRAG